VDGPSAVELILAGASAVQVGTATFADARSCRRVVDGIAAWCQRHGVSRLVDLVGGAHDH
jgi:dihydroorotate dehydrogenase (NAD+) catalytic subunit